MKNPYDHQFLSLLQRCDDLEFKKDFFNQLLSSGKTSLCKKIKTLSLKKKDFRKRNKSSERGLTNHHKNVIMEQQVPK